jgi:hypothetical protein
MPMIFLSVPIDMALTLDDEMKRKTAPAVGLLTLRPIRNLRVGTFTLQHSVA